MLVCGCMRAGSIWNLSESGGLWLNSIWCSCVPSVRYVESKWCHVYFNILWLWFWIAEMVACRHDLADCQVCIESNLEDFVIWRCLYCITTSETYVQHECMHAACRVTFTGYVLQHCTMSRKQAWFAKNISATVTSQMTVNRKGLDCCIG